MKILGKCYLNSVCVDCFILISGFYGDVRKYYFRC